MFFTHFLRQRDYDGMIRFNHDKERLDITIKVIVTQISQNQPRIPKLSLEANDLSLPSVSSCPFGRHGSTLQMFGRV